MSFKVECFKSGKSRVTIGKTVTNKWNVHLDGNLVEGGFFTKERAERAAASLRASLPPSAPIYTIRVWFAVDSTPRDVGKTTDREAGIRFARTYLGADAKGVWVIDQDGVEVKF